MHLPLYDVHWTPAVVLDKGGKRGDGAIHVGLPRRPHRAAQRLDLEDQAQPQPLRRHLCPRGRRPRRRKGKGARAAHSRRSCADSLRPTVQGAVLVLENKTGRILAMAGGFSYPLSQLNRTSQTQRQPGSAIKPLTYLTALQAGLQPNTLVLGRPDHAAADQRNGGDGHDIIAREYGGNVREEDFWTPRNADNYACGGISRCGVGWRIRSTSSPPICSTAASAPIRRKASTTSAPRQ